MPCHARQRCCCVAGDFIHSWQEQCKALGLVEQKTIGFGMDRGTGFEVRRFDFILTPDGQAVVDDLKKRKPAECRRVLEGLTKLSDAFSYQLHRHRKQNTMTG